MTDGAEGLRRELEAARSLLAERREQAARLRHDLRGALSPMLLLADRLAGMEDPACRKAAEKLARAVDRATGLLDERPPTGEEETPPA